MSGILIRIQNGDQTAVAEAVDTYGPFIQRLARRYLNRRPAEVDDAVQDVFIAIWRGAKSFDPSKGTEAAFVSTIARRRLIDAQRRIGARPTVAEADGAPLPETTTSSAEDEVDQRPETQRMLVTFESLPDYEKRAIWLFLHGGLTHRQIADVTEVPLGTVKSRLRRGLARLHEQMTESMSDPAPKEGVA